MARIRTFIAVEVSERIRGNAIDLQRNLAKLGGDIRWTPEDNFHLTLLFLGEVNELELVPICRTAAKVARKHIPFTMQFDGLGCFPTPRRPKVLWAGVSEGSEDLRELHEDLEAPLLELGCYRREERAFTPHLTLGYIASADRGKVDGNEGRVTGTDVEEGVDWSKAVRDNADWTGGYCQVEEILVMTSELRRSGSVYSVAARAKLGL